MNEEFGKESELIIDPNRLFVTRSPTDQRPSPVHSVKSCPEELLTNATEKMHFGLAWLNLTYAPQGFMSKKPKTILSNISGQIKFGEIMALMGPSGCGKSTLLRCINGRIASGLSVETQMYVSTQRSIHSCFIVQDSKEHLLMNLTTKECLLYASQIKNNTIESEDLIKDIKYKNNSIDSEEGLFTSTLSLLGIKRQNNFDHISNVQKLLTDLTLNDCADTMLSDCSGGQQKRIVVALELTANIKPNIICIDEPTSGLDSNAAEQVIDCLRNICRDHSIGIITTIHQPNSDILFMFDSLYVLSKGGYCIYNGRPQCLKECLTESNIAINETQVPIEVLMKVASKTTFSSKDSEEFEVHNDIKVLANKTKAEEEGLKQKCQIFGKITDPKNISIKPIDFNFLDFWVLIQRSFKCSIIRGWKGIFFLTLFEIGAGLFNCYLFRDSGADGGCLPYDPSVPLNVSCIPMESLTMRKEEPPTVKNVKFIFFAILFHNFLQLCYTILTYPMEIKLFFNEQQNRWYSTGAYYWAKNLIDGLIGVLITYCYLSPIYAATAQRGSIFDKYYGLFLCSHLLSLLCIQGMCNTFSIIAVRNFKMCLILGIGGMLINCLFSGFLIPVNEMDRLIQIVSYSSFVRLAFETQIYIIYGFNRCDPNENKWSLVLYQLDINEDSFRLNMALLVFYTVFWRTLALVCLIIKTNDVNFTSILNKNFKKKKNKEMLFEREGLKD